jgi:phage FluMu protein Com
MIQSDLEFDGDRCNHCGRLLHKHYGGHELYPTLRFYDGDIVFALMVDIRCGYCGVVNEIFWAADMIPPALIKKGAFKYAPTLQL